MNNIDRAHWCRKNQEIRNALRDAFVRGACMVRPDRTTEEAAKAEALRLYPDFRPEELTL